MFAPSSATAGLAAAIAGHAVAQARKAGLWKVDDIIADAMLNPDRAALLLSRPSNEREAAEVGRRIVESCRRVRAPRGSANGNYRHGMRTQEKMAVRRAVRLMRESLGDYT